MATRLTLGTASFSSSRRLAPSSGVSSDSPVMLPPGRARLEISPVATRSSLQAATTMGIVLVARLVALSSAPQASTTMTSTLSRTSLLARSGSRSALPSESCRSMATFRPSM